MDIIETLIAGVVSGVIASIIIYLVVSQMRPTLVISKTICYHDKAYWVKVINRTKTDLVNVDYTLAICKTRRDCNFKTHEIDPVESKVRLIDAYSKNSKNHEYALQISYKLNPETQLRAGEDDYYQFVICATRPFFGTSAIARQDFKAEDIIKGVFSPGNSVDYVAR